MLADDLLYQLAHVVVDQVGFRYFNRKIGYQRKEAAQHEGQQHKGAGNPVFQREVIFHLP
ncbi:hypothetical protein D3C86_2137200 [compost metagenome]